MDLASSYRALVRKHFPQARIVADRFHVIRLINHHFLACLAGDRSGRQQEPRPGLADAPPSPQSATRATEESCRLSARPPRCWTVIYRFKQRPLLPAAEETPQPQTVRGARPSFPARRRTNCARPAWRSWSSSARPCTPGPKRSSPCGVSPATTASPKDSTTKWRSSAGRPTASATLKTTDSE